MSKLRKIRNFIGRKKEEGAAIVEYGLLIALIALACILALTALGRGLGKMFNGVTNTVNGVPTNTR